MRSVVVYLLIGTLGAASSCKSPATKYRLSAEQLAWQPYQQGQVLRFGNSRTSAIRTYQVVLVTDAMVEYGGFCICVGIERPQFQQRTVTMQRTDTIAVNSRFNVLSLSMGEHFNITGVDPNFQAATEWDGGGHAQLPIDEVNAGLPFDTTSYGPYQGSKLLPTYAVGTSTYTTVVQTVSGFGPTTAVYHAKSRGVVAFEDKRTGLWYRLP